MFTNINSTTDFCTLCKGYHDFPLKIFCPTVPKHFAGEPYGNSENFGYQKILCLRGGYHDFLSETFCLTVPKNFVSEPFSVSENFWYRKMLTIRERGHHDFPSIIFCLTVPKHFVEEPLCAVFEKISGSEKVYRWEGWGREGVWRFSFENFLSHSGENFVGEPFSVSLISGIEKC